MSVPAKSLPTPILPENERPKDIIYGPVNSRRFGRSLGINILGSKDKICSYNCSYCDLGTTALRLAHIRSSTQFPSVEEIENRMHTYFSKMDHGNSPFDVITLSGNGDPTLHPEFPLVVERIMALKKEFVQDSPLYILTNGAHADNKKIMSTLQLFDKCFVKLDAGNNDVLKSVNDPLIRTSVSKLIFYFKKFKNLHVQSFFVRGEGDNTQPEHIEDWIEVLGLLKPQAVHLLTINHQPASPTTLPVEENFLHNVANKLYRRTQIKATVYY